MVELGEGASEPRALRLLLLAALLIWAALTMPLALGTDTLFLRDVATTHLHFKAFGAAELEAGRIPAIRPDWALGQPFRGNPNALAFYPGNLLYRLLPLWSAFNLHYMLHWLLAFLSFRTLARELGFSPPATVLAALTYAGSGWTVSCLTFYNLLTVVAWWPWVVVGALRGGTRGIALGGLSCGMALLGGEPLTAALGLFPLLWLVCDRSGVRQTPGHSLGRGLLSAFSVGLLGLWVALPQGVATWRVLGHSWRGLHGTTVAGGAYALHPLRLLELLVPFPFGRPDALGPAGVGGSAVLERVPYVFTLYFGVAALALALLGLRVRKRWAIPALLGLALATLGSHLPALFAGLSGGLFRYPEKLLFWVAFFVPLLAAAGLETVRGRPLGSFGSAAGTSSADTSTEGSSSVGGVLDLPGLLPALLPAGLVAGLWILVLLRGPALVARLTGDLPAEALAARTEALVPSWHSALLLSLVLLLSTAVALWCRSTTGLVLVQLAALLPLLVLVRTDDTDPYRQPAPLAQGLAPGTTVFNPIWDLPLSPPDEPRVYDLQGVDAPETILRLRHLDLDFPTGPLTGLSYPLAPDLEGLHSPLHHRFLHAYSRMDPETLGAWLRALGVEVVMAAGPSTASPAPPASGLQRVASELHLGVPVSLYRVENTAPRVWCPEGVEAVPSPGDTFDQVGAEIDPVGTVRVPVPVDHRPCKWVRWLEESPDRLVLEVDGPGGLVVLRRAYQPLYRAVSQPLDSRGAASPETERQELTVLPANLLLLGVEVPPGRQRVVIEVTSWPETVAGVLALAGALAALVALWWGSSRQPRGTVRP